MPDTFITDIGEDLIALAAGDGPPVAITHIGIGDGGGQTYDPTFDQTALVNEITRLPILSRTRIDARSWGVKVNFDQNLDQNYVREIGAYDAAGNLITIWAGKDVQPRQVGTIDYLVDHILNFSRVREGLVIVEAPDDQAEHFRFATLRMLAQLVEQQFIQSEQIRANTRAL